MILNFLARRIAYYYSLLTPWRKLNNIITNIKVRFLFGWVHSFLFLTNIPEQFTERDIMELFTAYVKFDQFTSIPSLLTELNLTELSFNYLLLLCVKHRNKTLYEK